MSGPADVLAVMHNAADLSARTPESRAAMFEARAAVAELIEAAKNARSWIDGCGAQAGVDAVLMEIDAALARVQGGSA